MVATATWLLLVLAPGAPTDRYDDPRIPAEYREARKSALGLDRPLPERYLRFLSATLQGDLGFSHQFQEPVTTVIKRRVGPSLLLGGTALLLAVGSGLSLGLLLYRSSSSPRGGAAALTLRSLLAALYATPGFWLALMAIAVFAHRWQLLPASGLRSVRHSELDGLSRLLDVGSHLILPAVMLALPLTIEWARHLSAGLQRSANTPWVLAARSRGLSELRILLHHMVPSALTPLVQITALAVPGFFAGAVILESVFAWPGLGKTLVDSVLGRDYDLAIALTLLSAAAVLLSNLAADWISDRVHPESDAARQAP